MEPIAFASSNPEKLAIAKHVCAQFDMTVNQVILDIDEIQGENPELVVADKARRAFEQYGKPIVVSDDFWSIPALGGFPGAYMKSMNYWFKTEDFIRLMHGISDRRIYINQYLAYCDGTETITFSNDLPGVVLDKPRGESTKAPCMCVVQLDADNGLSIAEVFAKGPEFVTKRYESRRDAWHGLLEWYKEKHS